MHKNPIWLAFLACLVLIVLWFTGTAIYKIYLFERFDAYAEAQNVKWTVKEKSDEEFLLDAHYNFLVNGGEIKGDSLLTEASFWNAWAAEQMVKEYTNKKWIVWYSSKNPHYSTLQKNFPLKECISMGVLWALLFYFLWLGYYVAKYRT